MNLDLRSWGRKEWTRRKLFRFGGAPLALRYASGLAAAAGAQAATQTENVYTRIGVRPYINCTAAYTIYSGLQTLDRVKRAMDEGSRYSVSIDELMDKAGQRLAQLLGAESAIVSAGAASAFTLATAACVVGADPEKMQTLPHLQGLKDEVIMPRESRNEYDHAIRAVGVKLVTVGSRDEMFGAMNDRTAMIAILADSPGPAPLEAVVEAAHRRKIPVAVDAAAEVPRNPNPYIARGADLVAYSGGKYLRGPQCSGILLGRKDLIEAAWVNSAPHHGFGRTMKVGKEEIIGLVAAVEGLQQRNYQDELRMWNGWFEHISERVKGVPGVSTRFLKPVGTNPHPKLMIDWDANKIGLTSDEVRKQLLVGEPRIMILESTPYSIPIRAAGMNPGDDALVAQRLIEIFKSAPPRLPIPAKPAIDLGGLWKAEIRYALGMSEHTFHFNVDGNKITGTHTGSKLSGDLSGMIDGSRLEFGSKLKYAPQIELDYKFTGRVAAGGLSGDVDLGEYGRASWTARRS